MNKPLSSDPASEKIWARRKPGFVARTSSNRERETGETQKINAFLSSSHSSLCSVNLLSSPSKLCEQGKFLSCFLTALPILHESFFWGGSWDRSERKLSILMSWSLEKLKRQCRPTPFIQEGSSQSSMRGSSLGRRGAAVLPWEGQDHQDAAPCPCLSCVQFLTWWQTMEGRRKDFLCLNLSLWWGWGSRSCVLQQPWTSHLLPVISFEN